MSDDVQRHFEHAVQLFSRGDHRAAAEVARSLAQSHRDSPDILNLLAVTENRLGNLDGAISATEQAIRLRPDHPIYHSNLAEMYRRKGDLPGAIRCARRAIALDPHFHGAHCNLGNAQRASGQPVEAEQSYRRALELNPQDPQTYQYLGNLYVETGKLNEAVAAYLLGWRIAPDRAELAYSLAQTYLELKDEYHAEFYYKELLNHTPAHALALKSLAVLLQNQGRFEEGLAYHRRYVDATPSTAEADAAKRFHLEITAPVFSVSRQQIERTRARLAQHIAAHQGVGIKADLRTLIEENLQAPSQLIYHGSDNRELKEHYARLFAPSFIQHTPDFNRGKIRIGFFVTRGHEGIFAKFMGGLIGQLDPGRFECWVICEEHGWRRWIAPKLTQPAVRALWTRPDAFEGAAASIRGLRLDILYHWEIGTDAPNYFMPFLRLAPVQVTSIGWPDTSGIPTVDYFISSRLTEPPAAEQHYCERLVRLERLPLYHERPTLAAGPVPLESLGIERRNRRIYVCAQNLRKLHPDQDRLIGAVLRRDPDGLAVFVRHEAEPITRQFELRFSVTQPDVADRAVVLRRLDYREYLSLLHHADAVLDSLYFGGANTTYDAFAVHRPVVTLPGTHARGRYTAGCYAAMGIDGCVAWDPDSYVEIAVRLANDRDLQRSMSRQIEENSRSLFGDPGLVEEYQAFFETVARG